MTSYHVLGRSVAMPVEIRLAHAFTAVYSVSAAAAQRAIDYSGLEILPIRPGRGACCLVFVDYVDGDLGPYNEFGVCFLVRPHDARSRAPLADLRSLARGRAGVLIHRLPVDGEFTLAAGRGIWGFPKELADFDVDHAGTVRRGVLRQNGRRIVDMTVRPGLRVPGQGARMSLDAYSHIDGVTRHVPWRMHPKSLRSRPGGATLRLGEHPWSQELAGLQLSKHALFSSVIPTLGMTFEDATVVRDIGERAGR